MDFYTAGCRQLDLRSYEMPKAANWFDIGKPETLEKAQQFYNSQK
jgi:NDP-sugar pyrophosphorylase family protein